MSAKKTTKSFIETLRDSPVGQPFVFADKVFLASLGLFSTIQTEFGNKFDELVKDGEVARDEYQESLTELQDKVSEQFSDAKTRIRDLLKPAAA